MDPGFQHHCMNRECRVGSYNGGIQWEKPMPCPACNVTPPLSSHPGMTVSTLVKASFDAAEEKGFHSIGNAEDNVDRRLLLIISEIVEAHDEVRSGRPIEEIRIENGKPEGVSIEIADAVIRIADFCGVHGIDLEKTIRMKLDYNKTRPRLHGRTF